jgi:2-iminobutanoate/2-iminopropanoate deaminase
VPLLPAEGPFRQVVRSGDLLFCSGIVCADVDGAREAIGDIAAETRAVLTALDELLQQHGSALALVVRADVHIADIAQKPAMDAVYRTFFSADGAPARTTVGVTGLYGGCLVEITVVAEVATGVQ